MGFVELSPLRKVAIGGTLGDVESQLPENHPYSDPCRVTTTHEGIHGVNARVRNETRNGVGLYFLNGKAFVVPNHPNFTLRDLANEIPQSKRGRLYTLYLQNQQQWWNGEPLYVADELTAYCYGAKAGFELGMTDRAEYSRDSAREFWIYSRVAATMARSQGYEHQAELDEFLEAFHAEHFSPLLRA